MSIVASLPAAVKTPAPVEDVFRTLVARTLEFARLAQGLTIEQAAALVWVAPSRWTAWEKAADVPTLVELGKFPDRFELSRQEAADLTAGVLAWLLPYSGAVVRVLVEEEGRPIGAEWVERPESA